MSIVKNQHYVPKSYLRSFAHKKAKMKGDFVYSRINKGEIKEVNITNVCASRYLYDIPELGEENKQNTEKIFAKTIDAWYPEVIEFVKDESNQSLPNEMRGQVIGCVLSLIFRNRQFLNANHDILDMYSHIGGKELTDADKARITAHYNLYDYSIRMIKARHNDCIVIHKADDGLQFITSDNPVVLSSVSGTSFDYFDPQNFVKLAITPQYCISIAPTSETELRGSFFRSYSSLMEVVGFNKQVVDQSETFVIGAEGGLQSYDEMIDKYDKPTKEGLEMYWQATDLANKMSEFHDLMTKEGINSPKLKIKAQEFWDNNEHVRSNTMFKKIMIDLGLLPK